MVPWRILTTSLPGGVFSLSLGKVLPRGLGGTTLGTGGSDGTVKRDSSSRSGASSSGSLSSGWRGLGSGPTIRMGCEGGMKGAAPTGGMVGSFGGSSGGLGVEGGLFGRGPTIRGTGGARLTWWYTSTLALQVVDKALC